MIFAMSSFSELWAEVMLRATVHGAIAVGIVLAIGYLFSKYMSSKTHCWLWRLVFVKLLLLAIITTPIAIPILPGQADNLQDADTVTQIAKRDDSAATGVRSNTPYDLAMDDTIGGPIQSEVLATAPDSPFNAESTVRFSGTAISDQKTDTESAAASTELGSFDYSTPLFAIWLIGVLASIGFLVRTWLLARRINNSCEPLNDPHVHQFCQELCTRFDIKAQPELSVSRLTVSPLLVGSFNPKIVFPTKTLESLDHEQLQLVIAHELSHLKRRDLWWSWIPTLVQILFFFHPFVWAAKTRWLLSREMACDELVLAVTGQSATSYADALINVSSCMSRFGSNSIGGAAFGATCMVQTSFSLKRRIQAMKNFTNQRSISWQATVAFGMTALLAVIPWQPVQRQVLAGVSADSAEGRVTSDETNLDFEQTDNEGFPASWAGGGMGYELTSSPDAHSGKSSGQIEFVGDPANPAFGSFTKGIRAGIAKFRGKRVRYSGFLKSDMEDEAWAGIWMRVDVKSKSVAFDNMNSRPVKGKTDWTEYSVVLDVPEEATNINYGFLISGVGTLRGDDLKIEIVGDIGEGPQVTDMKLEGNAGDKSNLDFEEIRPDGNPAFWGGGGKGYEFTASPDAHHGESCGKIQSVDGVDDRVFGTFTSWLNVVDYAGKRVRYTGYLKSEMEAGAWAGLWMRVDGDSKSVAFDNMQQRPVKGETGWTEYSIVLDVPASATNINFGFLLSGEGTLWGDDLKFEIVGDAGAGPEVTDMKLNDDRDKAVPTNLGFESGADKGQFTGWFGGGKGFSVTLDGEGARTGKGSVRMERIDEEAAFSGMSQQISAEPYRGKKIMLTGFIRTEQTTGAGAGLWLRIDATHRNTVGFDNMSARPILGTTDWKQYEIEMKVPDNSNFITFGVLLKGGGIAWADDFSIEAVN